MNKRILDRYFRALRKQLLCDRTQKDRILSDLRLNAEHWVQTHPEADEAAFLEAFGTPEEIAASYMEEMGLAAAGKKVLRNRARNITVIAAGVLLVLAVIVILSVTTDLFPIRQTTSINPMEYIAQIGLPWDVAMENLGLNFQQLEEVSIDLFKTPRKASFYSYDFDVYLILSKWGNYVKAFEYYLEDVDPKEFTKLSDTLIAIYGEPVHSGISQEAFDALIQSDQADSITNQWIVRYYEEGELEEYRPAANNAQYWPNDPDYDDYILCTLKLIRDETGSYRISLSYSLNVR